MASRTGTGNKDVGFVNAEARGVADHLLSVFISNLARMESVYSRREIAKPVPSPRPPKNLPGPAGKETQVLL